MTSNDNNDITTENKENKNYHHDKDFKINTLETKYGQSNNIYTNENNDDSESYSCYDNNEEVFIILLLLMY